MFGLAAGDLGRLKDFVSPSFFDVLPARTLWSEGRSLLGSRRDRDGFDELLGKLRPIVSGEPVGITMVDALPEASSEAEARTEDPGARGQAVLRLYFAQLAHLDTAAVDLRHQHFRWAQDRLQWAPAPLFSRWDPDFLRGVRELYAGFYRGDDAMFEGAAERLGLTPALDLFVQQFGTGDQTSVTFEQEAFKSSFHAIFVRCRDAGLTLNGSFIPLGVMLGALYEHLSTLAVPLNVRAAFESVWPS